MSNNDAWVTQLRERGPEMMQASPYARTLASEIEHLEARSVVVRLPYQDDFVGDPDTGVIAGGVVTALLDQACGWAVWSSLEGFTSIATLDLRIDYMRPARPKEALKARAECYKLGRSIAFVRGLAYEDDPANPVAAAQGTFVINSDRGRKPGANLAPSRS